MDSRIEAMYNELLANGELTEIFPELKRRGHENTWEADKKKFYELYRLVNDNHDIFINFEEL